MHNLKYDFLFIRESCSIEKPNLLPGIKASRFMHNLNNVQSTEHYTYSKMSVEQTL